MTGPAGKQDSAASPELQEAARLVALRGFDRVEPEPDDMIHRLVRLAARVLDTQFSALAVVTPERVRIIASHGFGDTDMPRSGAAFDDIIKSNAPVWIADCSRAEPPHATPPIAGLPIRFFAGAPLRTDDGTAIGVLSVFDQGPRPQTDLAAETVLADLASSVMSELERQRLQRQLETIAAQYQDNIRQLDLIFDKAPIGLVVLDRDLRYRRINELLAEMNGKSAEQHIGRTVRDMVPNLADALEPLFRGIFERGQPFIEWDIVGETAKEPGVQRVWLESFYPVHAPDGHIELIAGIVREVTEERRLQLLERRNAGRLRRVLDGIGALAGLLDVDGTLIEANRTALNVAGLEPQDVLGKPFEQTYWWAYSATIQAQLKQAIERARAGETVRYDVPVRVGDNRQIVIDFQIAPLYDEDGQVTSLVASAIDVTERQRFEAALAASEALFRETFEQMAVGMAHVGLDGHWLQVNDRLCEIVGYPREQLLKLTFRDITHPDDLQDDDACLRRLLDGEIRTYAMEKRYIRLDGSLTWANLTVSLRRTPEGHPGHFISVVEDINARKQAEERLIILTTELNHRVKNVVATIQSVIAHTYHEGRTHEEYIDAINGRIRALAHAHDALVRSQWYGAALTDVVTDELQAYDLDRIEISGPPIWLKPNAALPVCLIVPELATNAAKYGALSRREGRLSVRWEMVNLDDAAMLQFCWEECGGPTVAAPSTRGFGSHLVERLATSELGGLASLTFAPQGVQALVHFPLADRVTTAPSQSPHRLEAEEEAPVPGDDPLRVLVVEDSALIALDEEAILVGAGHSVVGPAASVAEALALIDEGGIDVALLDIDLAGELATPVADRLSAMGIPFVLLTGFGEAGSTLHAFAGSPVIRKPFDERTILDALAQTREHGNGDPSKAGSE